MKETMENLTVRCSCSAICFLSMGLFHCVLLIDGQPNFGDHFNPIGRI